ncbi:EamA family transporter [Dyadobacter sp. 32]|uniref:DMT family transporter n=1 Tax=Dyadobacter sp. 32 TaxID=538966 RepID=UPI0011EEC905
MKNILTGLLFSILWASASVATKFGVESAPPLILANVRFFIAGILLLLFSYLFGKDDSFRLPRKSEFGQLALFGFLNTTLYLGLYVYAMKYTAAGIGSLAVSTNPLIIVLLSALWLGRRPVRADWMAIVLGMSGIAIATYPLLKGSHTTTFGVVLLILSMIIVSAASVYYASIQWKLSNLLINGWQVMLGGIFLLPITLLTSDFSSMNLDARFWMSALWLSLAVSIVGLICWFYLLRIDTVRASMWLFLCPLFGFFFAWWLMGEPITSYTVFGTLLVLVGLYMGQRVKLSGKR